MKQNLISKFRKRQIIFGFVFCLTLHSCTGQPKPKVDFSKESFDFKKMDTLKNDNSLEAQKQKVNSLAYEDINIGHRILLGSISKETIQRRQIKSVTTVGFNIEKYDSLSYLTYEKCDAWEFGPDYKYFFDEKGKLLYLVTYNGTDTIKYSYDKELNLTQCGGWTIKYYPNGFKKSVENSAEIETYEYDINGNICHINFDIKPGIGYCGNRTSEWFGEYDKNHRLVRDLKIGFPSSPIEIYKYSNSGDIIQSFRYDNFRKDTAITDYIYKDNSITLKTRQPQ